MVEDLKKDIESLRLEVAELKDTVAKLLKGGTATAPAATPTPAPVAAPKPAVAAGINEETMFLISAAVAAFLGKRARIKMVRASNQAVDGWRLQGRVAIQGSHQTR